MTLKQTRLVTGDVAKLTCCLCDREPIPSVTNDYHLLILSSSRRWGLSSNGARVKSI